MAGRPKGKGKGKNQSKGGGSGAGKPRGPLRSSRGPQWLEEALDRLGVAGLSGDPQLIEELTSELMDAPPSLANVIANRLIEDREPVPSVMFTVLELMYDDRTPALLRRIAQARSAPDLSRLEARRLLGWEIKDLGGQQIKFLESLRDADGAFVRIVQFAGERWPTRTTSLL